MSSNCLRKICTRNHLEWDLKLKDQCKSFGGEKTGDIREITGRPALMHAKFCRVPQINMAGLKGGKFKTGDARVTRWVRQRVLMGQWRCAPPTNLVSPGSSTKCCDTHLAPQPIKDHTLSIRVLSWKTQTKIQF